ncbi:MAG: MATE family efflux transporter [Parasporobacterium sp.]|nr:MATE family efflux transporter [Parasporobacterium sp.]
MAKEKIVRDYTQGNVLKQLCIFMFPFMGANALQVVYSVVDMIIVGQFVGPAGLSAVSQGSMITNFAMMLTAGFANAGQILIAQLLGARKKDSINKLIGTIFTTIFIVAIVLTAIVVPLASVFTDLIQVPEEAVEGAIQYIVILGAGLVFTCGYNAVSAILRGMGDSRHPFIFIAVASVFNLVFDLVFTGWLGWGVIGAALATILGQALSFILALRVLYKNRDEFGFDFKLSSFKIDKVCFTSMFKLGIPFALQGAAINISMLFVNGFINKLGVIASATFGTGCKIDDIYNRISMGIQFAGGPMVAQNMGAGKHDRVKKVVWWTFILSLCCAVIFMACLLLFGRQMFGLFTTDPAVLDLSKTFILGILVSFPGLSMMRIGSTITQGTGNSVLIMLFCFIDAALRVVLGYLFGVVLNWGFFGFVLGYGLAPFGVGIPGLIYFLSNRWKKRTLLIDKD